MGAKFNVILYDWNGRGIEFYDVMPYFRNEWKNNKKHTTWEGEKVDNIETLKKWILERSRYMFWARCQYECLIAPWPYREDTLIDDLKKIDVHEQLMANIDVLVKVVAEEFKIPVKKKEKKFKIKVDHATGAMVVSE